MNIMEKKSNLSRWSARFITSKIVMLFTINNVA